MHARVVLSLVAAIVGSILAPSVTAASPVPRRPLPEIVMKGRSNGFVDFTLRKKITLDYARMRVSTSGDYAGYVISETTPGQNVELVSAAVAVPAFKKKAEGLGPIFFGRSQIKPGRYRMHLISQSDARVHIPAAGLPRSIALKAGRATVVQGGIKSLGAPPQAVERREPIDRTKYSLTIMGILALVENHQGSTYERCLLIEEENQCVAGTESRIGDGDTFLASPGGVGPGWWSHSSAIFPRWVPAGHYAAYQRVAGASSGGEYLSIVLDIDLTGPPRGPAKATPPRTLSMPYQVGTADGAPVCGAFFQTITVSSCGGFETLATERFATIELVDSAGGPVAARVAWPGHSEDICGKASRLRVPGEEFVGITVFSHPTPSCPTAHATTGEVKFTFSSK